MPNNTVENPFASSGIPTVSTADNAPLLGSNRLSTLPSNITPTTSLNSAPPKADAAPNSNSITVFTGLCDALNAYQDLLVKSKQYDVADRYEIVFVPASIGQEKVTLPEGVLYKATPMADNKNAATQKNPETNSVVTTGRLFQIQAGTQIVQVIDQIMKGSTYVTKQSNTAIAEKEGTATKTANNATPTAGMKWYKITFGAEVIGPDSRRNDNAYKMTFYINEYPITDMQSQYFPNGSYRGVHKSYSYWFTGENTQVLNFEQDYNTMFRQILTTPPDGKGKGLVPSALINNVQVNPINDLGAVSRTHAGGYGQSSQGADNGAGLIGASASDWLYSITNRGEIKLKIIGDPAWLQQGEVCNGVSASNFTWNPWNSDNGINFDASDVLFDIKFSRPADYNFNTGIVDVNAPSVDPTTGKNNLLQPQAHLVYTAIQVTSTFSKGKFEQELVGKVYLNNFNKIINSEAAKQKAETDAAAGSRIPDNSDFYNNSEYEGPQIMNPVPTTSESENSISLPGTQPQAPAQFPTSNGELTPSDFTSTQYFTSAPTSTAPQPMAAGEDAGGIN